jgi:protein-tyrosine phosphatase
MDKISKFRRKPKPPTIETSVERISTDITDTSNSAVSATSNDSPVSTANQKLSLKSPIKKSSFRNLRLRGSSKRARGSPPSELPLTPPAIVVGFDGAAPHSAVIDGDDSPPRDHVGQRVPAFLTLSSQDIDCKYGELVWAERERIAEGARHDAAADHKWGIYTARKGIMDRYVNIKPWNHNRVKLLVPKEQFDYVNASTVTLKSPSDDTLPPLRYIAMQGPTEPSFDYVWRMIAEQLQSPAVIVQLTTMMEGNAIKCHQYFPTDSNGSDDEGDSAWVLNERDVWADGWRARLSLNSIEEVADGAIEKRKLLLSVEGEEEPRIVWHLLYRKWPDFGVPQNADIDSFFELMRLSQEHSHPSSPRIIHCSAGIGRTGTFISLEHLMRELESGALENYDVRGEQPDIIYDTVDQLRQQRRGMVQGEIQYQFIYQVMRRLWMEKYGAQDSESREPAAKRLEVGNPEPTQVVE